MREKKAVTRELSKRYRRSRKKERGAVLDEFCRLTGYNRSYAARELRRPAWERAPAAKKRSRRRTYGQEVVGPLVKVWATLDGICGKRLAPFLPEIVRVMERCGELDLTEAVRPRLISLSASTIDRLLAPERKKLQIKGRSTTKPGSLLKHQIPVRTFSDWDEDRPGFLEIDLVSHDGGSTRGDFAQTLDVVDVYSGWTETRAVKNKAQKWVFSAIQDVEGALPFPVLGLDSDNGGEFINAHLLRYCEGREITFTRARAYRKNDSCYVEQKNYSVVRKTVGYARHDTEEEVAVLNELYGHLRLYTNFFLPNLKLLEKTRVGAKVTKRYDKARTPYQRLLLSPDISQEAKDRLTEQYSRLNPVELKREIGRLRDKLSKLLRSKSNAGPTEEAMARGDYRGVCEQVKGSESGLDRKEGVAPEDFEYILPEATNTSLEYIFT